MVPRRLGSGSWRQHRRKAAVPLIFASFSALFLGLFFGRGLRAFSAMICVLSPAKAMNLSGGPNHGVMSQPVVKDTSDLLKVCKKFTKGDLKKLMGVSDAIAEKDYERYQQWDKQAFKAACLAMDGPAYRGLDGESFTTAECKVAQGKVRILSGLYGVLKPFDAIRPYRLEMGSAVKTERGKNLYEFWGGIIAKQIGQEAKVIVNAASQEYWKAVKLDALQGVPVVTVDFPGPSVFAKKARGLICRYAVQHNCQKPEELKNFTGAPGDRYVFDAPKSTASKYVFRRVADTNGTAAAKPKARAPANGGTSGAAAVRKRPAAASAGGGKKARTA